ncbi:ATP-binding protein [Litchfieldia salsa]|uniref:histidine kinase n=1 Tax=Litchfieldia salsa TaxID=930152 RepID=A0A1H0PWV4_9BACI|nr:ATP-binding protein [Litchfieldia salsa]SDP08939.1 Signal transduction histidine kinase [Litchfieldia salsa]
MNRFFKVSIINRAYFITVLLVIAFVITLALFITNNYLEKEKESRAKEIYNVAKLLEMNLNFAFDDILTKENAHNQSNQEKVRILNEEIQPLLENYSRLYPHLGMGYYSIDLDSVIAIAPEFKEDFLKRVPRTFPYFKSYKTGKHEYVYSGDSIAWYGKSIFAITYPIEKDGRIIGHTWTNIKMDDLYENVTKYLINLLLFGLFLLLLLIIFIKVVFNNIEKQIKEVTDAIISDSNHQSNILLPELDKMAEKLKSQKKYEEEISKLDKLSSIGEMAATIAHEIRNPLTTIRGFLQLKSVDLPEKEMIYNQVMIEELDRANDIITEYLTLAKSADSYHFEQKNLNRIIEEMFPLIESYAIKENKTAILELGVIPDIELNKKEMKQLILNICRNGIEAMNQCGHLTIKTTLSSCENEVIMEISDEGIGIPAAILENIGQPFLTTKSGGNGLGLSVCYRIAKNHNATIDINTSPSGSTFIIKFK